MVRFSIAWVEKTKKHLLKEKDKLTFNYLYLFQVELKKCNILKIFPDEEFILRFLIKYPRKVNQKIISAKINVIMVFSLTRIRRFFAYTIPCKWIHISMQMHYRAYSLHSCAFSFDMVVSILWKLFDLEMGFWIWISCPKIMSIKIFFYVWHCWKPTPVSCSCKSHC